MNQVRDSANSLKFVRPLKLHFCIMGINVIPMDALGSSKYKIKPDNFSYIGNTNQYI